MTHSFLPAPPDHVPEELMVDFDMFDIPSGVEDPAEIWRELNRRAVPRIFYTRHNGGHWVFMDYDDIVEAYRDWERFSTHYAVVPPIEPFPVMQPQGVDPPQHKVFRSLLAPLFTPVAIRDMTEELKRRTVMLVDKFADRGHCDFIAEFAAQLPTGTFLHLMGLPEERLPEFLKISDVFFRSTDEAERQANAMQVYGIINELFTEKQANPAEDIATLLVQARGEDGELLPWQDKLDCAFLLFVAGLDTVTNTMAYVWRYMATTPQARATLREKLDDPSELLLAVEELLRINSVSNLFRRVKSDMDYKGVFLKENDRVIMPNTIANRDPAVFENPETIDLDRKVNRHVTFGVGPHRCIGSHLAKREILVALDYWLRKIPEFELASQMPEGNAFGGPVMGFKSLPLTWKV
ncbi:MAG: cytochrome P450 [Sphingomonadaceae bacterium]|nr:cytochrome P450 [Sphingomonadaceae bacterium]